MQKYFEYMRKYFCGKYLRYKYKWAGGRVGQISTTNELDLTFLIPSYCVRVDRQRDRRE